MGIRDNFKKGSVEMILLILLAEEDMYGYQLSQRISQRSGGAITIPEGSMYPTLYKLVDNKYISDYKQLVGKRLTRVYYHIEEAGKERLSVLLYEYDIFSKGLQSLIDGSKEAKDEA